MALSLTVEDGSGVANANSFADVSFIRAYNAQRGKDVPDDNDALIALAIKAVDYMGTYEGRLAGERALPLTQRLMFPRTGVVLFGALMASNIVPDAVRCAQAYLVGITAGGDVDLDAIQTERAIIREKIGPIDTQYSATAGATLHPVMPLLDNMLSPFFRSGASALKSVRV